MNAIRREALREVLPEWGLIALALGYLAGVDYLGWPINSLWQVGLGAMIAVMLASSLRSLPRLISGLDGPRRGDDARRQS